MNPCPAGRLDRRASLDRPRRSMDGRAPSPSRSAPATPLRGSPPVATATGCPAAAAASPLPPAPQAAQPLPQPPAPAAMDLSAEDAAVLAAFGFRAAGSSAPQSAGSSGAASSSGSAAAEHPARPARALRQSPAGSLAGSSRSLRVSSAPGSPASDTSPVAALPLSPRRPEAISALRASAQRLAAAAVGGGGGASTAAEAAVSEPPPALPQGTAGSGVLESPLAGSMVAFATGHAPASVQPSPRPTGLQLSHLMGQSSGGGGGGADPAAAAADSVSPGGSAHATPRSAAVVFADTGEAGPEAGQAPQPGAAGGGSSARKPGKRQLSLARGAPLL